jgi:hypothetical protein
LGGPPFFAAARVADAIGDGRGLDARRKQLCFEFEALAEIRRCFSASRPVSEACRRSPVGKAPDLGIEEARFHSVPPGSNFSLFTLPEGHSSETPEV